MVNYTGKVWPYAWTGTTAEWVEANGQASVLMVRNGITVALITIDATEEGIFRIMFMGRPSKLAAISRSMKQSIHPQSNEQS